MIMVNKKILMSCLLILLVAISVSAVSAADDGAVVAASDDNVVALGSTIIVDGDNDDAVRTAMDQASDGDIIELGDTGYTFDSSIEVNKQLTFHGSDAVIYANGSNMPDGVFEVFADGSGTAFQGITFINIDDSDNYLYKYNGMIDAKGKSVKTSVGIAINLYSAANNVLIDDCQFQDWYNTGVSINSANYATVSNSEFYGGSATFINNIPDGPKDRGTYHISVMGSTGTTVDNCLFAGTVCDGVSVAGGSYDSTITNNEFQYNAFSIYFGGKSTEGTLIEGNTFINCGWFESPVYGPDGETGENVSFQDLPVISVQKSSDSFVINNNTFYARNANVLIKALEGSTAHGGASNIGNITITNNNVLGMDKYDEGFEKIVMASVTLAYIETYNDVIRPTGEIKIANNKLNGARAAAYWTQKWGNDQGNVSISAASSPTTIAITSLKDSTIKGALKDFDGVAVAGEIISYTSDVANGTVETLVDGSFIIENVYGVVELVFEGADTYKGTTATVDVAPATSIIHDTYFAVEDIDAEYGELELVAVLVDDVTGDVIKGADVTFVINEGIYSAKTDANGKAVVAISDIAPGTYTADVSFDGSTIYNPSEASFNVVVGKIATDLSAFYNVDTNEIEVILLNNVTGAALKGANVVVTIDGEKYNVKINSKGEGALSLEALSVGTYSATLTYKGNSIYSSASDSLDKIVIKNYVAISTSYDAATKELSVSLVDSVTGAPLKGANVVVTIDGNTYNVKINSKGVGVLSLADFDYGTYEATVLYKGNANYNAASITADVVVKEEVTLDAVYDDATQKLTVSLVDSVTGAALKGANVVVKVNGETYKVKITSSGQGVLSLADLAPGTYPTTLSYGGNANYAASSMALDIVVKAN